MNVQQQIENIERSLTDMQEALNKLKQQQAQGQAAAHPSMIPKMCEGDEGWHVRLAFNGVAGDSDCAGEHDNNIFPTEEMAYGYAQAFRLMLEMRKQGGSGQVDDDDDGLALIVSGEGYTYNFYPPECYPEMFTFIPPFPSEELLEQAIENCGGEEHVLNVMKFLAGISKNVPKKGGEE